MIETNYIAIIGDIIESRNLNNREKIQNNLIKTLDQINEKYPESLASTFSIVMGDSIQALLYKDAPFIDIIYEIEYRMFPVEFRYGIGIGTITTDIHSKNSQLNDGPAYHRARQTLEIMDQMEQQYATHKTDMMLLSSDKETTTDRLVNGIFSLNTALKSKWSKRQNEIIKTFLNNDENQYKTAEALDIGQSSVSKSLKTTNFYTFKNTLEDVQNFIHAQLKDDNNND